MRSIEGVYVANVTPFEDDASLKIDVEAYLAHASWLGEKGVSGIVPFGTNGEGPSVALGEKLVVLEALSRGGCLSRIPAVMQATAGNHRDARSAGGYPATAGWSRHP